MVNLESIQNSLDAFLSPLGYSLDEADYLQPLVSKIIFTYSDPSGGEDPAFDDLKRVQQNAITAIQKRGWKLTSNKKAARVFTKRNMTLTFTNLRKITLIVDERKMNLRKEIRRVIKEVRVEQNVNVEIKFRPNDDGDDGKFFIEDENFQGIDGATFDEALKYFRDLLIDMKSNSL